MRKAYLFAGITALLPMTAGAGAGHNGGHHDHGEQPVIQKAARDRHDDHGHMHQDGDHHAQGHGSMAHRSAVGTPADESMAARTIRVDLLDSMRFGFDSPLDLRRGEVVRFLVSNRGRIRHEFSIGSETEQKAHRAMMRQMPDMVHEDPNTVTVEPGETRVLTWRFEGEAPVVFACNIPGHSEGGMIAEAVLNP